MEKVRYDLLLAERLSKRGCLNFSNRKTLHFHLFQYVFNQMQEGLKESKFPTLTPKIFEFAITNKGVIVYTIHKHGKILKYFKTDDLERKSIQESMELLEKRLGTYGLVFNKPTKCDYSHPYTDIFISVYVNKN